MQDMLASGRRFRTLNVLDTATRECLAVEVDTSLPAQRVVRVHDRLVERHGMPQRITLDNGPEFTGQALDTWAYQHGVTLDFIDPGKPMQNGHLESFDGKFRDECLNGHWFLSLEDARRIIGEWEEEYNTDRPHSALGDQPLAVYARTVWPGGVFQNPWHTPGSRSSWVQMRRKVAQFGPSPILHLAFILGAGCVEGFSYFPVEESV